MEDDTAEETAEETTIATRKQVYIKKILELLNSELAVCGQTSLEKNRDVNAILEALPTCTMSVAYSLQLAKPMLIDVLKAQAQFFLSHLQPLVAEEQKDLYKAIESPDDSPVVPN